MFVFLRKAFLDLRKIRTYMRQEGYGHCYAVFIFVVKASEVIVYDFHKDGIRSSHRRCSARKVVLRNFSKFKRVCFLIKLHSFIKKDTLAQVLSCEFFKISKNTFFIEHLRVIPSVKYLACLKN